jgi:NAD(P)-dependent dehydrogenase (short-subunit alcohol dehydrogenase family)
VVVTGAGRGIGLATTLALLAEGYHVHGVDVFSGDDRLRDPAAPPEGLPPSETIDLGYPLATADALNAARELYPHTLSISSCDVRDPGALLSAVQRVEEQEKMKTGAAVGCAGIVAGTTRADAVLPLALERAVVEINLFGIMNLARATLPSIRLHAAAAHWGRFVAVSSVAGTKALPQLGAYVASKHAVEGFVHTMALDLRGTFATANTVAPGSTKGVILDRSAAVYNLGSAESFADQHLTHRLIEPEEIAHAIGFLLSDRSSSITGSTLTVDGGLKLT